MNAILFITLLIVTAIIYAASQANTLAALGWLVSLVLWGIIVVVVAEEAVKQNKPK